jgi:hypothetical protein
MIYPRLSNVETCNNVILEWTGVLKYFLSFQNT